MGRSINSETERSAHIHADVYAFGLAVFPENLRKTCRVALEELGGMTYVEVPFSLAHSMFETLEVYIRKALPYLGQGSSIIAFDRQRGVLEPTELGAAALKKLRSRITAFR